MVGEPSVAKVDSGTIGAIIGGNGEETGLIGADFGQIGAAELNDFGIGQVENGAIGADAFEGGADFLDRLDGVVLPVPEIVVDRGAGIGGGGGTGRGSGEEVPGAVAGKIEGAAFGQLEGAELGIRDGGAGRARFAIPEEERVGGAEGEPGLFVSPGDAVIAALGLDEGGGGSRFLLGVENEETLGGGKVDAEPIIG
ncbi:MAG: hypothetical protein ACK555_20370 [Acidobacteriota bacterium]